MTVAEWLREAQSRLEAAGVDGARTEARVLAAHALGVPTVRLLTHPEEEFPDLAGEHLLARRLAGEPLAYLTGRREFYGREFAVRPGVLVPRHETEELVTLALELLPRAARTLDVGVGSGCVGITLALERPDLHVSGTDLSETALEVARENADRLGARFPVLRADLFPLGERFDAVVSNPPYIRADADLPPDVAGWEPPEALFAGADGLGVYRRLARETPAPVAVVEIGFDQSETVPALFSAEGWTEIARRRDLGGHVRALAFRRG